MIRRMHIYLVLTLLVVLLGCRSGGAEGDGALTDRPPLETYADTVAMRIVGASGGSETWKAVPYLRFNFSVEADGVRGSAIRHLWDRRTGDYRVEMPGGTDTTFVVLFNVHTREGQAYLNGEAVDSTRNAELVQQAYRRFINDTYWLLAPVKLFDPGVRRTYVPDSSDADTDVIKLSFENVGLTPGDQYWLYAERETGRLRRWAFLLEGSRQTSPSHFVWTGYEEIQTPAGPVHLATRKEAVAAARAILTDSIAAPEYVDPRMFSDPSVVL